MNTLILSLAAGLLCVPIVSLAELYKWTDEQGHLHITDAPPAGAHKKSALIVVPSPQPPSPRKARVRSGALELPRAEASRIPAPGATSQASEELPLQLTIGGLNPFQAMMTSPWQVFDSSERDARAPVQSWKDKQGLDHVVDVLPVAKGGTEIGTKVEDFSTSRSTHKGKGQAAGVSHSRHQVTE